MGVRTVAAVAACRISRGLLRLLGRGGTSAPGKVACKLYPGLLGVLSRDVTTIVVTGTNGKTTTSRMIEKSLQDAGIRYFANKSGANMLPGITAEFAMHSSLAGRCDYEVALVECDEAAFRTVSRYIHARCVVVTNIFRDQLDRYGEVTHTLNSILTGIRNLPEAVVCINADDSLCVSIHEEVSNEVLFYGVEGEIYADRVEEVSDAPYCIHCKTAYVYKYVTYGHLGGFYCPHCGYHRPDTQVAVERVLRSDADASSVEIRLGENLYRTVINLPGGYNIYNAAAAAAAGCALRLSDDVIIGALGSFECGFGRMEKFPVGQTTIRMILIKNPAGCNQVLNFLSNTDTPSLFVAALNDRFADGTDISWIWDVDFEKLCEISDKLTGVWVTGIRADDMALRFKYAGVPAEKLRVVSDYDRLLEELAAQSAPVYLMPTYTAMLDIRERLSKKYGFKEFWE